MNKQQRNRAQISRLRLAVMRHPMAERSDAFLYTHFEEISELYSQWYAEDQKTQNHNIEDEQE